MEQDVADQPVVAGVVVVALLLVAVQAAAVAVVGPASEVAEARGEALAVDAAVLLGEVAEAGAAAVTSR